jgi:prolipoprotein diacylglyceryltransferase
MLDTGLLLTGAAIAAVAWLAARWAAPTATAPAWDANDTLDVLLWAGMVGLLAGRAAAVLLDDPDSLQSLGTFLVIRGGVEMWPGAAVAAIVLAVSLRRRGAPVIVHAALMAPAALAAYAAFEASCIVREGCYGPRAAVGLRPDGLDTTMVPLGILAAVALVGVAVLLARRPAAPPLARVLMGLAAVALVRSVASIWLPRIGDELTRQHRTSILVLILSVAGLVAVHLTRGSAAVR